MSYLIAIGADHRGFAQKQFLKTSYDYADCDIDWVDVGANNVLKSDYPVFARLVCDLVVNKKVDYGVLLCGSGVGMSIVANRYCHIYAGIAWNCNVAHAAKSDDNVNVLILPSDFVTDNQAGEILHCWLTTSFSGTDHKKRLEMVDHIVCR